ncbi:MAG: 50S ribosomal protein L17 [Bacteroidales bacterium]|nr:50S ribosomal protein L17 [Bacteroidales bacterium]
MRHRKGFKQLSRKREHRQAMLANMANSLILHKRIFTTLAKAKALRIYVEPLITKAKHSITTKTSKEEATHLRRIVFSYLRSKESVTELFREVSSKVADRPGGYTRIIKTGNRTGDNAEMCLIELVDFNENLLAEKEPKKPKTARRRRGAAKKVLDAAPAAAAKTAKTGDTAKASEKEPVDEAPARDKSPKDSPDASAKAPESVEPLTEQETPEDPADEIPEAAETRKSAKTPAEEQKPDAGKSDEPEGAGKEDNKK